ncbi:PAS domain S-box protein [Candidatus Lokiarchaeum ossiferum]|uniref:PAS domain S-box protein n=1 Tax=Candidatus Lokiarchaeum ossiferum TaxID=2951803 RepID=UPI00352FDE7E
MPFRDQNFQVNSIEFFISILDHLNAPIFVKNDKHIWIFVNQSFCNTIGRNREEIIGRTDHDFYPKEEADIFWKNDSLVLDTGNENTNIELASWIDGVHSISTTKRRYVDSGTNKMYIVGITTDITKETIAQKKLLKNQKILDEILSYSTDISYKIDLSHYSYVYLSDSIEEILGWPLKKFIEGGRSFSKTIFHPDDLNQMESIIEFTRANLSEISHSSELEIRLRHKDGRYRWFLDRFSLIIDQNDVSYMIGTLFDITERKHAEFALIESEEKFRNLIDQAPFDFQIYDTEGYLQVVNKNFQDFWGIDPKNAIGRLNILTDPLFDKFGLRPYIQEAFGGKYTQIPDFKLEPGMFDNNKEKRWLRTIIYPIKNDRNLIQNIAVVHQDITAYKKSLQKIEENERKYNYLFNNSRDAIILHEISGKIIEANQSALNLFGYSREEILSFNTDDLHPTDKKILKKNLTDEFLNGFRGLYEITMQRKNGETFDSNVTASIISLDSKNYIQAIVRDISEQKRKDAEQLRSQKIESIALLAGGIAHDFNNILVGILGNVNYMQLEDEISKEMLDSLQDIEKATLRATDLTKQLLTFSKGGAPLKKAHDITSIINESISFVMRGSKSRCVVKKTSEIPVVDIDAGQMNQVFNNLLINANQAMISGGEIDISLNVVDLVNSVNIPLPDGHYVHISIEDQGEGISPEIHKHIFEPYFTTKEKGNGLGLATSYSIIKRHGGYITFESQLSLGTTFHIYLPISEKEVRNNLKKSALKQEFKGKVIIMDDDPMILKILSKILTKFGLSVDIAYDGEELLRKYTNLIENHGKYRLVIMDLTIPGGIGGKETISELKKIDPDVIAIVSSGYSNDPILANYKKFGFSQVLNKPYTIESIKHVLSEFL